MRPFCTSCPESCIQQNLGLHDSTSACLEHVWGDGTCDQECNNAACHHNDCTDRQAKDMCLVAHDRSGYDATEPFVTPIPLKLAITLPIMTPVLHENTNRMLITPAIDWIMTYPVPNLYRCVRVAEHTGSHDVTPIPNPVQEPLRADDAQHPHHALHRGTV